jgi:protein disulfide-isomerase
VEKFVFTDAKTAETIARYYVPMKVHVNQFPQLAQKYNIHRWPTDVVVTPSGLEIHRTVSSQSPERYALLVEQIAKQAGIQPVQQAVAAQSPYLPAGAQNGPYTAGGDPNSSLADGPNAQPPAARSPYLAPERNESLPTSSQEQFAANSMGPGPGPYRPGSTSSSAFPPPTVQQPPVAAAPQAPPATPQQVINRYAQQPAAPSPQNNWPSTAVAPSAPQPHIQNNTTYIPPAAAPQVPPLAPSSGLAVQGPATSATPPAGMQLVPASKAPPVALDGCCPVTLIEQQQWKKADAQFGAIHRGRTYLFTSADEQKRFLADPDRYSAVLSGYDAVRYATSGQLVDGKREFGMMYRGQIYLFADENARKQFSSAPHVYSTSAHQAMMRSETSGTVLR